MSSHATQAANRELVAPLQERLRGKTVESHRDGSRGSARGRNAVRRELRGLPRPRRARQRSVGAPNLTDGDWLYGGDGEAILTSILDGRRGAMPAFTGTLPDDSILDLAHYVASLSGTPHDSCVRSRQADLLQLCACHGADGKGNPALGAPNLTDAVWLYGSGSPRASPRLYAGAAPA